jgi:hypothetical protein
MITQCQLKLIVHFLPKLSLAVAIATFYEIFYDANGNPPESPSKKLTEIDHKCFWELIENYKNEGKRQDEIKKYIYKRDEFRLERVMCMQDKEKRKTTF